MIVLLNAAIYAVCEFLLARLLQLVLWWVLA